jgi:hypothetical protein
MLEAIDDRTVDWATAEELALASVLSDGVSIRLTGEDVERGTFSHRHAVLHDVTNGRAHVPLQTLPQAPRRDSQQPLTENAVPGSKCDFLMQEPLAWSSGRRMQHFINSAQVVIDSSRLGARGAIASPSPSRTRTGKARHAGAPRAILRLAQTSTCASPTARARRISTCCGGRRHCCSSTLPSSS